MINLMIKVSGRVTGSDHKPLVAQLLFCQGDTQTKIHSRADGRFRIDLPFGKYDVEVSKGSEYERLRFSLDISDYHDALSSIELRKLYTTDWIAGDLHQHSHYSPDAIDAPYEVVLSNMAAGLRWGAITDHDEVRAAPEFTFEDSRQFTPIPGVEVTTALGHINALNHETVHDSDVTGLPDIKRILDDVRQDPDSYLMLNHPFRSTAAFSHWELYPEFDLIEIWNGRHLSPAHADDYNGIAKSYWFQQLNEGHYVAAVGGSDNHDVSGYEAVDDLGALSEAEYNRVTQRFSGTPRNYVHTGEQAVTATSILDALTAGRSFITNNPLAYLSIPRVNAPATFPGDTVPAGEYPVRIQLQSNRSLSGYRLIKNGETVQHEALSGMRLDKQLDLELVAGDWILLEAYGTRDDYAITNPIFVR